MSDGDETQQDDGGTQTRREGPGSERAQLPKPEQLARGTAVGRYLILDVVGEGGMGVVYAAFDPELDRKVAIKLLQARPADGSLGDQAWLLREAQAMARLSHPNVLAVHDVGTLSGDRVFVAMELVEGTTLRSWLEREVRPWQTVLPILRAAGAGLAAAHAAGLVHRDFKPDNVLVGDDGRVRVMDFGLARLHSEEDAPARPSDMMIESRSPLSSGLTVAGTLVGTPAYMAPEIHDGLGADARSDQFAFGVALYEALYRIRPFEKKQLASPRDASVKPRDPLDSSVPVRLQRVIMRAIAIDPDARFPSVAALLAELDVDADEPRRRLAWVGGGAAVVAVVAVVLATRGIDRTEACTGASQRLAGVWDDAARKSVRAAFDATKRPFAAAAFAGVEKALDAYATEWTAASTGSCEATKLRNEQSAEVLALRQSCFDDRLEELRALTALFVRADGPLVERGDKAVWALEPIRGCANVAALLAATQPPPELRAKVAAIHIQLDDVNAQIASGKYDVALVTATAASDAARAIADEPLRAKADVLRATSLMGQQKIASAEPLLADAVWAALRGKRDDLAAEAALAAARAAAQAHPDAARLWLGLAQASAVRSGIHTLDQAELETEGIVAGERGDLLAAIEAHTKALAAGELAWGHDAPALWRDEQFVAASLAKGAAWAKAVPHFERALALRTASVGDSHPDVALILSSLGGCYGHLGEGAKARAAFERSIAIRETTFGKTSPLLIVPLNNIADFLRRQGDVPAALASVERGKAIAEAAPGTGHPLYHTIATTYGEVLTAAGRLAEARAALADVLALEAKLNSPVMPATQTALASVALAQHAWLEAADLADHARAAIETGGGKDSADLVEPLTELALAKIQLKDPVAARALLERAIAIGGKAQLDAPELAPAKAALAAL